MSEALLRPQSAGTAILASGSGVGTNDSNTYIFMKVASAQFAMSVGVMETTGDGDEFTQIDHNNEYRGQVTMRGFVLADHEIGFEALVVGSTAASPNPVTVKFKAANGRFFNFKMVIKDIVVDWSRTAPIIGIAIVGLLTGESVTSDKAFSETSS